MLKLKAGFAFGEFEVDFEAHELRRTGQRVKLTPKAFAVLTTLVARNGAVVTKDELMQQVWPDTAVEDAVLSQNVYTLRKLLGQSERGKPFIETLPRRGYRFSADSASPAALNELHRTEQTPLIGRHTHLARLHGALDKASAGRGRFVFVSGEPGIGKTSLITEFVKDVETGRPNVLWAKGHCVEQYGAGEAYGPFLEAFTQLLAGKNENLVRTLLRTHAPTWCAEFPSAFSSPELREQLRRESAGANRERMIREICDVMSRLASERPLLIIVEDLHWADHPTLDLLQHAQRRIGSQAVLIVVTCRRAEVATGPQAVRHCITDALARDSGEEIAMGPLTLDEVRSYIDVRFAPHRLPEHLFAVFQRKTQGNPLFMTRVAEHLVDTQRVVWDGTAWMLSRPVSVTCSEVPETIASFIRKRLEPLDAKDRQVLDCASVAGNEFLSVVVADVAGGETLETAGRLNRLSRLYQLLTAAGHEELPDGTVTTRYAFAHSLFREVLYGDMPAELRANLHRACGRVVEKRFGEESYRVAAQLAVHFEGGGDTRRAIHYLREVAANAARRHANSEAVENLAQALALVEKLPNEEQDVAAVDLLLKRQSLLLLMSHFDEAAQLAIEAVARAREAGLIDKEVMGLQSAAHALFFGHRVPEMRQYAEQAVELAAYTGDERLQLESLCLLAQANILSGARAEIFSITSKLIDRGRTLQLDKVLMHGLGNQALTECHSSRYEDALLHIRETEKLAIGLGDHFIHLFALFVRGMAEGNLGRVGDALSTLGRGRMFAQRNGDRFWEARLANSMGWLYCEIGDHERALRLNEEGIAAAAVCVEKGPHINALVNMAYSEMRTGRSAGALARLDEAERVLKQDPWMAWRYTIRLRAARAEFHQSFGEWERAAAEAQALLEWTAQYPAAKYEAIARIVLGEVALREGNIPEAHTAYRQAEDLLLNAPTPLVAWRVYAGLARVADEIGLRDQAAQSAERLNALTADIAAGCDSETADRWVAAVKARVEASPFDGVAKRLARRSVVSGV